MTFTVNISPDGPLSSGPGFSGATAQPDAVGDLEADGYDARMVAHWSTTPYLAITASRLVSAFGTHREGFSRAKFSMNGGPWRSVTELARNPDEAPADFIAAIFESQAAAGPGHAPGDPLGKPVYSIAVDPDVFASSQMIEVRAILYPVIGEPRVLSGMFLYVDPDGNIAEAPVRYVSPTGNDANDGLTSGSPKLDMALAIADMAVGAVVPQGATLYLMAGVHTWTPPGFGPNLTSQEDGVWLTISAAPGLDREDVTVVTVNPDPTMMFLSRVRWVDIKFNSGLIPYTANVGAMVSLDRCVVDGIDRFDAQTSFALGGFPGGFWLTNSVKKNTATGDAGGSVRNCVIDGTLAGGPWTTPCVINTTITRAKPTLFGLSFAVDAVINTDILVTGLEVAEPTAGYIGIDVEVTGGVGWTVGWYTIEDVVGGKIRLNASPAAAGTSGGTGAIYSGAHPDLWRSTGSMSNVLLYGYTTPDHDEQGNALGVALFTSPGAPPYFEYNDFAFVDCHVSSGSGIGQVFVLGGNVHHMYVLNCSWRGAAAWDVGEGHFSSENFVVEGTGWYGVAGDTGTMPAFPGVIERP